MKKFLWGLMTAVGLVAAAVVLFVEMKKRVEQADQEACDYVLEKMDLEGEILDVTASQEKTRDDYEKATMESERRLANARKDEIVAMFRDRFGSSS